MQVTNLDDWSVAVGRVRTAYGLQGEIKVLPLCDDPERFAQLPEVCVLFEDGHREIATIRNVKQTQGELRLALEGVNDRTEADRYRHATLLVRKDMRVKLPSDTYYVGDLCGLEVVTTDGRTLGTIRDVLLLPGNDVYVTEHAMIPAVKEIVRCVDVEGGRVIIEPLEGLAPDLGL